MNASELLDNLQRAGATLEIVDGKPRLRGAKISDELKQALQENRAAVLAEFEARQREDRDRYGKVPPADASLAGLSIRLDERAWPEVIGYVMRQVRPVHAWVMRRADEYHARGMALDECEGRACVDVIAWQRNTEGREAVEFVLNLAAAAAGNLLDTFRAQNNQPKESK